jgi:hypothetical protein
LGKWLLRIKRTFLAFFMAICGHIRKVEVLINRGRYSFFDLLIMSKDFITESLIVIMDSKWKLHMADKENIRVLDSNPLVYIVPGPK